MPKTVFQSRLKKLFWIGFFLFLGLLFWIWQSLPPTLRMESKEIPMENFLPSLVDLESEKKFETLKHEKSLSLNPID